MRAGIISDSHGCAGRVRRALREMGRIDLLIHLGDGVRDAGDVGAWYDGPVIGVRGNQDFGSDLPPTVILTLEGQRVMLTHGHIQQVKRGLDRLAWSAREQRVRMACYGHTHRAACETDGGILYLNPGSLEGPGPGYAVVRIERDRIAPALHALEKGGYEA